MSRNEPSSTYRRALEKDRNLGQARLRLGNLLISLGIEKRGWRCCATTSSFGSGIEE